MKNAFFSSRRRVSLLCAGTVLVVAAIAVLASATLFQPAHARTSIVPVTSFMVTCVPDQQIYPSARGFNEHVALTRPRGTANKETGQVVADQDGNQILGNYTYKKSNATLILDMYAAPNDHYITYHITAQMDINGGSGVYTSHNPSDVTLTAGACTLDPQRGGTY